MAPLESNELPQEQAAADALEALRKRAVVIDCVDVGRILREVFSHLLFELARLTFEQERITLERLDKLVELHRELMHTREGLPLLEFDGPDGRVSGTEVPEALREAVRNIYGLGGPYDAATNRKLDETDEELRMKNSE